MQPLHHQVIVGAVTCWASLSVKTLSCRVSTEPQHCHVRWFASSFYFFVRLHIAKIVSF